MSERIVKFRDVLGTILQESEIKWVYLPADEDLKDWSLESKSAILEPDEVPPELEDEPDAGTPEFAKQNGLYEAIQVAALQDVVINARTQKPDATLEDLFRAFVYYYDRDAFIVF